jgi:hypothetical protein
MRIALDLKLIDNLKLTENKIYSETEALRGEITSFSGKTGEAGPLISVLN